MKISKSTIELYKLRNGSRDFADITIDDNGNAGRISISSSYGNWSNYWAACGESFKKFLCGLDIEYAANKFGVQEFIDLPKTIQKFKVKILDAEKNEAIKKDEARILISELKEIEESANQRDYFVLMVQQQNLMKFFDFMPSPETDINPQFRAFWNEFWKPFLVHLQSELCAAEI